MSIYISRVLCFLAVTAATFTVVTCAPQTVRTITCYSPGVPTRVVAGPGEGHWNYSQIAFGTINVFDQPLRESPDPRSKYMGQVRGMLVVDTLATVQQLDVFMLDFVNDQFNGSVSILGSENLLTKSRQLPIVGGTGHFLFAKGYIFIVPSDFESTEAAISTFSITVVYKKAALPEDF